MAANSRHKKARMLRYFMIETKTVNMFKEDEKDDTIFFRSIYPMGEDKVQVVMTINDSPYLGVQALLLKDVGEDKNTQIIECLNELNLELPTLKYVLTKDHCVVVSMFFPADEKHFGPALIMGTVVQMMKTVANNHFARLKSVYEN